MKTESLSGIIWFGLLCSFLVRLARGDDEYIIGKEDDETLLTLSIVFLVICVLFLLVAVVMAAVFLRLSRRSGNEYKVEEKEERYQSMYLSSKQSGNMSSYYEELKANNVNSGVYQSIDESKVGVQQNNDKSKRNTPPGTEKGQKDSKETEKETRTLSAFNNPAYQSSSMNMELDEDEYIRI